MFTIYVTTNNGKKTEHHIIEEQYALWTYVMLMQAEDVRSIVVINGLTGEVLHEYADKRIKYINGYAV